MKKENKRRKEQILTSVIFHYIRTGQPVGSETIVKTCMPNVSSATIRNYLAELEEEGYLAHMHTSSGRVPTDKGYRFYVDNIMEIQRLATEEEKRIIREYTQKLTEVDRLWLHTSKLLAMLSHYAGFILVPHLKRIEIRSFHLVKYDNTRILVIIVATSGMIKHQIVNVDENLTWQKIKYIENFMNTELVGSNIIEIEQKWKVIKTKYLKTDTVLSTVITQIFLQLDKIPVEETYVEGETNLLTLSEFNDLQKAMEILHVVKDRQLLAEIMQQNIVKQFPAGLKVNIAIGSENPRQEFSDWSLVTTLYPWQEHMIGMLGILGPKRMDYGRMVAIVDSIARAVDKTLKSFDGKNVNHEKK